MKYNENYQITFPKEKELYSYNSSIIKENGNYLVYSRISNYNNCSVFNRIKHILKNTIYLTGLTKLDKNFNIISQEILNTNHIEDLRVFSWNNKKYFIGCEYYDSDIFWPVLLDENFNKINILDKNNKEFIKNKNFVPIVVKNQLFFVKNHNPLEILKIEKIEKDNIILSEYFKNKKLPNVLSLRGSTPYINIGDNRFLAITHDFIANDFLGKPLWFTKTYRHYFTVINFNDINRPFIEKVSKSFCLLGDCGIEFVMGFIESYDGDKYIITLGKNDCTSHVVTINKEEIFNYF